MVRSDTESYAVFGWWLGPAERLCPKPGAVSEIGSEKMASVTARPEVIVETFITLKSN